MHPPSRLMDCYCCPLSIICLSSFVYVVHVDINSLYQHSSNKLGCKWATVIVTNLLQHQNITAILFPQQALVTHTSKELHKGVDRTRDGTFNSVQLPLVILKVLGVAPKLGLSESFQTVSFRGCKSGRLFEEHSAITLTYHITTPVVASMMSPPPADLMIFAKPKWSNIISALNHSNHIPTISFYIEPPSPYVPRYCLSGRPRRQQLHVQLSYTTYTSYPYHEASGRRSNSKQGLRPGQHPISCMFPTWQATRDKKELRQLNSWWGKDNGDPRARRVNVDLHRSDVSTTATPCGRWAPTSCKRNDLRLLTISTLAEPGGAGVEVALASAASLALACRYAAVGSSGFNYLDSIRPFYLLFTYSAQQRPDRSRRARKGTSHAPGLTGLHWPHLIRITEPYMHKESKSQLRCAEEASQAVIFTSLSLISIIGALRAGYVIFHGTIDPAVAPKHEYTVYWREMMIHIR